MLLGDCLDHEIGTVADVSRGSEQNSAHGNGGHLGFAAGEKFLHGGRILDAQTGAAKSVGKERQVSSRSDATKTNFMQPEINQEVFAAFARANDFFHNTMSTGDMKKNFVSLNELTTFQSLDSGARMSILQRNCRRGAKIRE